MAPNLDFQKPKNKTVKIHFVHKFSLVRKLLSALFFKVQMPEKLCERSEPESSLHLQEEPPPLSLHH